MSATTTDITGNAKAFSSFLRIPVAGYRDRESGSVSSVGSGAYLWSRSAKGVDGRGLNITRTLATFFCLSWHTKASWADVIGSTICPSVYTACITNSVVSLSIAVLKKVLGSTFCVPSILAIPRY
jgi:hypothetical protein